MKRRSIVIKLISCFLVAIIVPMLFLSVMTIKNSHAILANNMELTSVQTLKESANGFALYIKNLTLQLNILSKKSEFIDLETNGKSQANVSAIENSIVAAINTTENALRGYYATNSGKLIRAWSTAEAGTNVGHHILENEDYTQKDWFINASGASSRNGVFSVFTEPYIDADTGKKIFTISQEVKSGQDQIGSVALDIEFTTIENFVKNISLLKTGFVLLTNQEGDILVNSKKNNLIKSNLRELSSWNKIKEQSEGILEVTISGQTVDVIIMTDEITGWRLVGFISQAEISSDLQTIVNFTFGTAIAAIAFGIIIAILVTASIKRKINLINAGARSVAKGDFTQAITLKGNDEFTELSRNFNSMSNNISLLIQDVDQASNSVLNVSEEIATIASESIEATKNVFVSIYDVAESTTKQAHRIQEASIEVDNLALALDQTRQYVDEKFSHPSSSGLSEEDVTKLNSLVSKANENKDVAIRKVENIAADSEEMASAAEEVTDLTKEVSQSMTRLDDHTKNLTDTACALKIALSHFKLNKN